MLVFKNKWDRGDVPFFNAYDALQIDVDASDAQIKKSFF
jgi:hypothetical protein